MPLPGQCMTHSSRQWTDMTTESFSEKDTYKLGESLGRSARSGQIFCLDGDLGCGKTVFCAGFAKGLGINTPICSPTFTILQIYEEGRLPLYHFDVYRISDPLEMEEVGFDEYIFSEGVSLIEWGSMIDEILPARTIRVTIEKDLEKGPDFRRITIDEASCD